MQKTSTLISKICTDVDFLEHFHNLSSNVKELPKKSLDFSFSLNTKSFGKPCTTVQKIPECYI